MQVWATLQEVIRYDAVLTADLLRQANSTMQAVRDAITDVDRAVRRLGTTNVVAVAMTRAMRGRFSQPLPTRSKPMRCGGTHLRVRWQLKP